MSSRRAVGGRGFLSRKWRSLRLYVRCRARFWMDVAGLPSAIHYLIASGTLPRGRRTLVAVKFRSTKGNPVRCRVGTTDAAVIRDTFGGLSQLPPASLQDVRQILDLGSNIGATIVHYGHVFPECRILGVEMDRANYELCIENTRHLGDRCRVLWGGVWSTDGQIHYQGSEHWGYHISMGAGGASSPAFSMATILRQIPGQVDFLKMDIEGAERELLRDASEWAGRVNCMKVEVHPPYSVEDCMRDLIAAGFRPERDPDQDNEIIAFNTRRLTWSNAESAGREFASQPVVSGG
ncbi:MAG TPA: FkbM family methyltransferase [Bryobacteraceae bacterium]|nr:FkbM family methyltransferase [Bryobacteraceae bacterium]